MNIIESLEAILVKKKRTLSEHQTLHLHATIAYLKGVKKDFISAKKEYDETMKEAKN